MRVNEQLADKILACWMGKNIGGTLGGPLEGVMQKLNILEIPKLDNDGPLPNDDLDLQLVNLHALEQRGLHITAQDLSEEWAEHVYFPYDEYGYALANIRRNIASPLSGCYNNPFVDCMGSPIRSELWAAISPGVPDVAAYYAYQDSAVDHAGGEGMYGEVFFAVLESLAYVEADVITLITKALGYIPESSRVYKAVLNTLEWYRNKVSYDDIRELILEKYGNDNFTDAPQNIAFTMVGFLYGEDFGDCMLKTVNLGYDTDCTCATLGSIYGIIYGTAGIPEEWSTWVGDKITISPEIKGMNHPGTITELTRRTILMMQRLELENKEQFQVEPEMNFENQVFYLPRPSADLKITISGADGSSVMPGVEKALKISFCNESWGIWRFKPQLGTEISEVIELAPKQKKDIILTALPNSEDLMTAGFRLSVIRLHDNQYWKKYDVDFVLPMTSKWNVDGSEVYSDGGFVKFSGIGVHSAETALNITSDRLVKLICASDDIVTIALDGETVINSNILGYYMPAFHRCPEQQTAVLHLAAGTHKIKVDIECRGENGKVMLLPVSTRDSECPGQNYYFVDCTIGAGM